VRRHPLRDPASVVVFQCRPTGVVQKRQGPFRAGPIHVLFRAFVPVPNNYLIARREVIVLVVRSDRGSRLRFPCGIGYVGSVSHTLLWICQGGARNRRQGDPGDRPMPPNRPVSVRDLTGAEAGPHSIGSQGSPCGSRDNRRIRPATRGQLRGRLQRWVALARRAERKDEQSRKLSRFHVSPPNRARTHSRKRR